MEEFNNIPQPKNEIDGALEELCQDEECHIKFHPEHLQDDVTWIIRPVLPQGEVNLREFAQQLRDRLNLNETNEYLITVDDIQGAKPYIRIEKLTTNE